MSKIILPGQQENREIALQTREGNDIKNYQTFESSLWDKRQIEDIRRKYSEAIV